MHLQETSKTLHTHTWGCVWWSITTSWTWVLTHTTNLIAAGGALATFLAAKYTRDAARATREAAIATKETADATLKTQQTMAEDMTLRIKQREEDLENQRLEKLEQERMSLEYRRPDIQATKIGVMKSVRVNTLYLDSVSINFTNIKSIDLAEFRYFILVFNHANKIIGNYNNGNRISKAGSTLGNDITVVSPLNSDASCFEAGNFIRIAIYTEAIDNFKIESPLKSLFYVIYNTGNELAKWFDPLIETQHGIQEELHKSAIKYCNEMRLFEDRDKLDYFPFTDENLNL